MRVINPSLPRWPMRVACPDCGSGLEVDYGDIEYRKGAWGDRELFIDCPVCYKAFRVSNVGSTYEVYIAWGIETRRRMKQ